jgi:hypothetical protein
MVADHALPEVIGMGRKISRGDKFFLDGTSRVCLEVDKKQVLALGLSDFETELLPLRAARTRSNKRYDGLIEAIDKSREGIVPENKIQSNFGVLTVRKVFASGDISCEDEGHRMHQISKWELSGTIGRMLLASAKRVDQEARNDVSMKGTTGNTAHRRSKGVRGFLDYLLKLCLPFQRWLQDNLMRVKKLRKA